MEERIGRVEQQLAAVLRRLDGLEGEPAGAAGLDAPPPPVAGGAAGTLLVSGTFRLGRMPLVLRQRGDLAEALAAAPEAAAGLFAALGSPFRILLLRALVGGPRSSQELQEALGVRAVGQLYHHLRELQAAGLVVQRRRSVYELGRSGLMAVCVLLVAAQAVSDPGPLEERDDGPA